MAYTPTNWENEIPLSPPKYRIVDDFAGEIATSAEIELVTEVSPGTPLNASNMNKIEQGIKDAHDKLAAGVPAIFAAKGDLVVGSGAGTGERLGVGTNGRILTANSSRPLGVEWANPPTAVPVGGIIMWSGSVANIPAGWALCDGQNGTPDLRNRFIIGAGGTYSPGNTGGSATVNLQHSHSQGATGSSGSHSHSQGNTGWGGSHAHSLSGLVTGAASGSLDFNPAAGTSSNYTHSNHDHVLYGDTGSAGTHQHTNPDTAAGGTHTHTNPNTAAALSSSQSIMPPYMALCYIMRIS